MASRPLADSPWFWAFLFGASALILAIGVSPKYARRQARLERMADSRVRAWESGGTPPSEASPPLSDEEFDDASESPLKTSLRTSLWSLLAMVGVGLVVVAVAFGVSKTGKRSRSD